MDSGFLLPAEPALRAVAEALYALVADAPIISPHGHVAIERLDQDYAYRTAVDFLIDGDHYITRLLHAAGEPLVDDMTAGDADPRDVWRRFCELSPLFAGTAVATWLHITMTELFGVHEDLDQIDADDLFDRIGAALETEAFRPVSLLHRFSVSALATTDDLLADPRAHARVTQTTGIRILPTPRIEPYVDPTRPEWSLRVEELLGGASGGYDEYLERIATRRSVFAAAGSVSVDIGLQSAESSELEAPSARALFDALRRGEAAPGDRARFRAHMLSESARMCLDDGLVLTLHAGPLRNHDRADFVARGPDRGHDIPTRAEFTHSLRPLLERYGNDRRLHLVVFSLDDAAVARELAPLAGYYPALYVGAPWWFLDAPDAMSRYRESVTETIGFSRSSGFIDDTRLLPSIPARHAVARRRDAGYLARLVVEGRMSRRIAEQVLIESVGAQPTRVFRL